MASEDLTAVRSLRWVRATMIGLMLSAASLGMAATATIYSCVDGTGKRLTSDRPIAECGAREQRVLNPDGSTKRVLSPPMTADERAAAEARDREKAAQRAAEVEAIRRDRNLRQRYPNEASHQKARQASLDNLQRTMQLSEKRLGVLAAEKKPLLEEAQFYLGRTMPAKLKQQLDGNEASAEAQRALIQNQQAEVERINARFDVELARLRQLWAGAPPGSLGPMTAASLPSATAASGVSPASSSTAR